MTRDIRFITIEEVVLIHEAMLGIGEGVHGVLSIDMLHAAVGRPHASFDGEDLYVDPFSKAAALLQSLALNHPFIDGNKRTAFFSAVLFLHINDCGFACENEEVTPFMLQVVVEKISLRQISSWLREHSIS